MPSYRTQYLEDVTAGDVFAVGERTVTEALIDQFAMLSGDWFDHHTSRPAADDSIYGERIAHGMLVFSLGTGLLYQSGVFTDSLVAVTEVSVEFPTPTYVGDTVSGEFEITSVNPDGGRSDDHGKVSVEGRMTNTRGVPVCSSDSSFVVRKRSAEE